MMIEKNPLLQNLIDALSLELIDAQQMTEST